MSFFRYILPHLSPKFRLLRFFIFNRQWQLIGNKEETSKNMWTRISSLRNPDKPSKQFTFQKTSFKFSHIIFCISKPNCLFINKSRWDNIAFLSRLYLYYKFLLHFSYTLFSQSTSSFYIHSLDFKKSFILYFRKEMIGKYIHKQTLMLTSSKFICNDTAYDRKTAGPLI